MAVALAAGDRRIEVVFAHAIDIPRMLAHADRYTDDYPLALEAARAGAHQLLDRCCALAAQNGVVARACVRLGDPVGEIAALADALAADLIVIGNRPAGKLHRVLNGSVRDAVVRTSKLPVLAVDARPSRSSAFHPECILAPLADPSASPAAMKLAAAIAKAYGARITFARETTGDDRALERAVAEHGPGMIVVGAAPRRLRDHLFPTAVERVLQSAPGPVLVVHG